ncbi:MAG: hypothetical protein KKD39_00735 [Candidatus Altiarchaeota archaeon]|nr:hypothetical protein [Candidatus Altiarchaeota archaeon]
MKKGMFFSLMTILLSATVLTVALYYASLGYAKDMSSQKVAAIFNDVGVDVKKILSTDASVEYDSTHRNIIFTDRFPNENASDDLAAYESFMEGIYARKTNTVLDFKRGRPIYYIVPTDLVIDYPTWDKNSLRLYNSTGEATGLEDIDIWVNSQTNFINTSQTIYSGDMTFTLNASFPNAKYHLTQALSRTKQSNITLNLEGARINIYFGANNIDGVERNSSLVISKVGEIFIDATIAAGLNGPGYVGVMSDSRLLVEDTVTREDNIWLTPEITEEYSIDYNPQTTTTTLGDSCDTYCISQGYSQGTCRSNINCAGHETYVPGTYCLTSPKIYCCCDP